MVCHIFRGVWLNYFLQKRIFSTMTSSRVPAVMQTTEPITGDALGPLPSPSHLPALELVALRSIALP